MLSKINSFLNSITMYRLVLYGLIILACVSILFGFAGVSSFGGISLCTSIIFLFFICYGTNGLLSFLYKAPTNAESSAITALILFFIMQPPSGPADFIPLLFAGVIAMASKYVLAIHRKHIFNPAALAVFILGIVGSGSAIWWVGNPYLAPFVLILGLLVVRKVRKFSLFISFLSVSISTIVIFSGMHGMDVRETISQVALSWPIIFFASIMLTEPSTMPPRRFLQISYAALVGVLFGSQFHIWNIYSTPQLALLIGNIFSYAVSFKHRVLFALKDRRVIASQIYEFSYESDIPFSFQAGQYMEWTLPHDNSDTRGNRRYFTIASSPSEKTFLLATRINPDASSSFKKAMLSNDTHIMTASGLAGDFTLPDDSSKKMVWVAGGIGITPFRSMAKYLSDTKNKRDIILFYSSARSDGFAYKDMFDSLRGTVGIRTIYILSDASHVPANWQGRTGFIDADMVRQEVPDYADRVFYLSGPNAMVESYKKTLVGMGVSRDVIVTDYFPGF